MPRISAATVADHRARQHAALLEAAREILATTGVGALTPAAVGAKVGLARSSVYRYFTSTADILTQLVEDAFPRWTDRLHRSLAEPGSLDERVRAFGRAAMEFATSPDQVLMVAVQEAEVPAQCHARIQELHHSLSMPLQEVLAAEGHREPAVLAALAWAIVREGTRLLIEGAPAEEVTAVTLDTLSRALTPPGQSPGRPHPPSTISRSRP
ncbi:TetR/AcrR family transcriptional regulator [Sphaerisporangium fuscum]|uniref:TetR/AcrR family transcriptional regulator n=1 Tax=Sphaerisporangium fuscum TaxID=2835868 RepID=UPI001BDC98EE|nr:TetR/AcrR family transcriptional regulator [Sphaerisporangium fuscum]